MSILLGNGDGTFQTHVDYNAGVNPIGVLVGDFNRDNKIDLAVLDNNAPQGISVLLGNGDGSFQKAVLYAVAGNSRVGLAADLNSDGNPDLAVAVFFNNDLEIRLGNGDGTFQTHVSYAVGTEPNAAAGGDLDGDGNLDFVTANLGSNDVSVLKGNGDGTFQPHVDYAAGSGPGSVVVGDFNGDGRLDLAVTNSDNTVSVLLQTGMVTLSTSNVNFGVQLVHTRSAAQAVTLTNSGGVALNITSIVSSGDFVEKNDCGSSVGAGASCTINVAFDPMQKGSRIGAVTITDDAVNSPQTIALTGTGTVVQLSPASVNFGNEPVGMTSAPRNITVTNVGLGDLNITTIGLNGTNFGDFAYRTTCSSTLAAGASCTVRMTFRPTATGARDAYLVITDNGGGSKQRVHLTGTGI